MAVSDFLKNMNLKLTLKHIIQLKETLFEDAFNKVSDDLGMLDLRDSLELMRDIMVTKPHKKNTVQIKVIKPKEDPDLMMVMKPKSDTGKLK